MQPEAALENDFGGHDDQEYGAHKGIQTEESEVDPVQAAAARDEMFEHEAADNKDPADEISDAKAA